ncbi:otu and uba-like domain-containing protein [Dermatophagoides farinae]|uniref:ubiquitinyl hydrolase 1 n=1 Tax=Dermatophagoides farinae TaxID=6954 RepID=A0A9D4P403_DERFA|nr:otu and uba-like domain-containing protein [Dermatophagoides farinae]
MEVTLSEFIAKTSCDPGLAQDLLNHHGWNLAAALKSYYPMNDIITSTSLTDHNDDDDDDNAVKMNGSNSKESLATTIPPLTTLNEINGHCCNHLMTNVKDTFLIPNKCTSEPSLSSQSSDACDSSVLSTPTKFTSFKYHRNGDSFPDKKLSRGISRASDNENLISKARLEVAEDFKTSHRGSRLLNIDKLIETPEFTFTLPDIHRHEDEFYEFLRKDLIEKSAKASLESSKRLNWWSDICHRLYPLVTTGDGNCLLHAASLGMWGFHDRGLILRKALHLMLANSSYTQAFYRRWRWQTHFQNSKAGLSLSEHEWEKDWDSIVRLASTEPRSKNYDSSNEMTGAGGKKAPQDEYEEKSYIYESLEEIHIFVLAHVLRRPIIVIADTMLKDSKGEAFFPILLGGIYLPLECPDDCLMKSPLCLTFDAAHFSALVAMNIESPLINSKECLPWAIPLMDVDHNVLPLHFAIDPGKEVFIENNKSNIDTTLNDLAKTLVLTEQDKIELLKKYFDILTLAHKKENCIEKEIPIIVTSAASDVATDSSTSIPASLPKTSTTKQLTEKSQTLPSNFGRKNGEFSSLINGGGGGGDERYKSRAKQLLQKPFQTFGKMGKKIKRNLGHLARRSTSFRLTGKSSMENGPIEVIEENEHNNDESNTANDNQSTMNSNNKINRIESIINTDNSIFYCDTNVLAAKLYMNKKLSYHDELIKNYLTTARVRFENEREQRRLKEAEKASTAAAEKQTASKSSITSTISSASSSSSSSSSSASSLSDAESISKLDQIDNSSSNYYYNCVNNGCESKSTPETNYLCRSCFDEQKKALLSNGFGSKSSDIIDDNGIKQPQEKHVNVEKPPKLEKINKIMEGTETPSSSFAR